MDWKKVLFVLKKEFPYIFENLKKYCSLNEGVYLILKDKKFKRQNDDDFKIQLDRVFFLTENIIFSLSKEYFRIFKEIVTEQICIKEIAFDGKLTVTANSSEVSENRE